MDLTIYTLTHKHFTKPDDNMYVPLQVGTAINSPLGYLRDDTGYNISALNGYYSELTGLYWIWKNVHDINYVGTCHYRRYLIDENEHIMNEKQYEQIFKEYELVTTKRVVLNNSYHYGFSANHNVTALDMTGEVIKELYPEYYDTFIQLVNGNETYFGNMIVTSKELFDKYAEWLFTIFFEVQKRIDMETDKDSYHRRVFGFISEFLLLVWVRVNNIKVKECKVGMVGEKAETRELKAVLSSFLAKEDTKGAMQYFMDFYNKRPDVLMEASDVTGELHLMLQITAVMDMQIKREGGSFYKSNPDVRKWFARYSQTNSNTAFFSKLTHPLDSPAARGRLCLLLLWISCVFCLDSWILSGIINSAMEICLTLTAGVLFWLFFPSLRLASNHPHSLL